MMPKAPKTILIIEDEAIIRETLQDFLESESFTVLTAENGLVAITLLSKVEMPQLILLDMKMPQMNGWEFAKTYAANYSLRAPIIVTTAAVDAEQRAKDVGAVDWIEKPFDLDILIKKVQTHAL